MERLLFGRYEVQFTRMKRAVEMDGGDGFAAV